MIVIICILRRFPRRIRIIVLIKGRRGKKNKKLDVSSWYRVSYDGKELVTFDKAHGLLTGGEIFGKRVTSLRLASESLMQVNLGPMYKNKYKAKDVAKNYGYYRWDLFKNVAAYEKRKEQLKKWSMLLEQGNMNKSIEFIKQKTGKFTPNLPIRKNVHERAMQEYARN